MAVEFLDINGVTLEPGDTVRITFEVTVETLFANRGDPNSSMTYADRQEGAITVPCDKVEKTASRP